MCNCIDEIEKKLIESGNNTMLDIPVIFSRDAKKLCMNRVTVSVCKRNERKREGPKRIFGDYCPFCGEEYKEIAK